MDQHDSSNSANDEQFEKMGLKKVEYHGKIGDSGDQSNSSESNDKNKNQSKGKRNNYSKQISNLLKQEDNQNGADDEKTKIIKKNCVSAKISRQRKKIYIELLEKKVESLKENLIKIRQKLKVNRSRIMHSIQESNKEKRVYIEQKMKDSKRLIAMSEQFTTLTNAAKNLQLQKKKSQMGNFVLIPQQHAHNYLLSTPQNLQPNQSPPQMKIQISQMSKQMIQQKQQKQSHLQNNRKSKKTTKNKHETEPDVLFKQLYQKKELLELGINSYLYKFGINGILKNDVVQLLKEKWYELVIDESVIEAGKSPELEKVICDFRDCFWQIDESNKKLDYLLRQLRDKIKPEYVVKFILEKQFFKSFSSVPLMPSQQQIEKAGEALKIEHSSEVKQQKEEEQYQQSISSSSNLRMVSNKNQIKQKMSDISESYQFSSQSVEIGNRKPYNIYQELKREGDDDLDIELNI